MNNSDATGFDINPNEVLAEHRPDIWVSDFSRAQKNHPAPQWQVCECTSTAGLPICD
ncbi:hypothetical protein [Microcoleus sp. B4-C1]|uniref:hypothetical protein n=1 Tax=Microcoleus sp. B4-C1 TaxID=2818660 RepID=UPI002FD157F4